MTKLLIFLILVILDLISKMLVVNFIDLYSFIQILFFIDITHIHNYGVSFGLLSGVVHPSILIIIGLLVVFFIYYLMIGSTDYLEEFGLLIILSGALSNIIDRIYNGYVVDFIYIHYKDFYWPAFNFADIYITIGIMMILINILIKIKKPS